MTERGRPAADRPITLVLQVEPEAAIVAALREALTRAMDRLSVPPDTEMALVLTDDAELARLNGAFRGLDGPTDVLSFPVDASELPPGEPDNLGDVVISVPYAARSAAREGRSLVDELRLLAVHGLLHLLGHEDESEAGAAEMRRIETALGLR